MRPTLAWRRRRANAGRNTRRRANAGGGCRRTAPSSGLFWNRAGIWCHYFATVFEKFYFTRLAFTARCPKTHYKSSLVSGVCKSPSGRNILWLSPEPNNLVLPPAYRNQGVEALLVVAPISARAVSIGATALCFNNYVFLRCCRVSACICDSQGNSVGSIFIKPVACSNAAAARAIAKVPSIRNSIGTGRSIKVYIQWRSTLHGGSSEIRR